MYLEIFLADFRVFRVFLGISRDFAEIPKFHGSATAQNIRSPENLTENSFKIIQNFTEKRVQSTWPTPKSSYVYGTDLFLWDVKEPVSLFEKSRGHRPWWFGKH